MIDVIINNEDKRDEWINPYKDSPLIEDAWSEFIRCCDAHGWEITIGNFKAFKKTLQLRKWWRLNRSIFNSRIDFEPVEVHF